MVCHVGGEATAALVFGRLQRLPPPNSGYLHHAGHKPPFVSQIDGGLATGLSHIEPHAYAQNAPGAGELVACFMCVVYWGY